MGFRNEHVPRIEHETSAALRAARKLARVGLSGQDVWTVNRDKEMVLVRTGCGREPDAANEEYWMFIERRGIYAFSTLILDKRPISDDTLLIERSIHFWTTGAFRQLPDAISVQAIKAALAVFKDHGLFSKFESSELVLKTPEGAPL